MTIVLVTHFMEEAERLCDRVAVIDAGRVAAIGHPRPGSSRGSAGEQRIRFQPSAPIDDGLLTDLPEVHSARPGRRRGPGDRRRRRPARRSPPCSPATTSSRSDLRVEQPSLDDAFVALTEQRPPST